MTQNNEPGAGGGGSSWTFIRDSDPPIIGKSGELNIYYETFYESETTFRGKITVKNPNSVYAWNGTYFSIGNIIFETSSQVGSVNNPDGGISFTQDGNIVTLSLGWQSLFPYEKEVIVDITADKAGSQTFPENFVPHYVISEDIIYPEQAALPASWSKSKSDLTSADLIENSTDYYNSPNPVISDTLILYSPPNSTQIKIGQPYSVGYPVNGRDDVRMWIPNKFMTMGLAFVQEELGINPNYLASLGTKENFAAGVVPVDPGFPGYEVIIDGETWSWPIVIGHSDGPYQVEAGNFNDLARFYPDYFPPNPAHGDYMAVSLDPMNPNWISSAIAAGLSLTVTRETLCAAVDSDYNAFMAAASDPWAEFIIITFAYNRGLGSVYKRSLFTTNRAQALASTDLCTDFDMRGFASHIPSMRAMTDAMNNDIYDTYDIYDIYDTQLSWADIESFLLELQTFFGNRVPTDEDWLEMKADIQNAFNILAAHWRGNAISFRYDFLTILRIIEEYRPEPLKPRPTGQQYYYRVKNAAP